MLRRIMDGGSQTPKAVHQVAFVRLPPSPNPSLRHFLDLFRGCVPAGRGPRQKLLVNVADAGLDHLAEARVQRPAQIRPARQPGRRHAAGVHAQLVQGLVERRHQPEYADRAGNGGRIGQHLVG